MSTTNDPCDVCRRTDYAMCVRFDGKGAPSEAEVVICYPCILTMLPERQEEQTVLVKKKDGRLVREAKK